MKVNSILSLIILLGAIQGAMLSLVLYRSRFNQTANKVLAASIFVVSIALLLAYFQLTLDYREYQFQIKSILPLSLIFIPLIYIYTRLNTKEDSQLSISDIKYFLPFFVVFIYNMPFYLSSAENKIAYYIRESITNSALLTEQIEIVLVNFIILTYSVLIVSLVLNMRKNFENEVSNYREELIMLMFFLAWTTLTFTLTGFILSILQIFDIEYPFILDFFTAIGSTFLIYFIGYYTLSHPKIFKPLNQQANSNIPKAPQKIKEDLHDDLLKKIVHMMEDEKLYRNPELTLNNFSEKINIPTYLVSKIINTKTNLNFYNFVNKYRIEEVKQELLNSSSPHILEIAFDAGFNTKSSFYNYFKKHTGISPKDFIKQQ